MPLTPGTRLGPYEIAAQIGVGGMGEVYRATDTNLKRQVAIKVLPLSLAGDADRLARFQREAEVLASLNHPNIAAIHGLDRRDGHTALVMELVEGPTLADRIGQGAVPLDEAIAIAKQMAEALEAAHERGIIHRDLKPANIKLRPDGTVKVLDFGLAKAADPASVVASGLATLATITSPAMTQVGMILGTAAYMSPEQARGRAVDKRTDIWAFGCVLFEMLAGVRPFDGEDVTEVIGAVIHKDVDWARLPRSTPAAVRTALGRCLEKDPKKRIRDIGDVALALDGAFASPTASMPSAPTQRRSRRLVLLTAAMAIVAAVAAVAGWLARAPEPPDVVAFTVDTPRTGDPASFAHSPDGKILAFTQSDSSGIQRLWIRSLDSPDARVIPGTDQALNPFWASDSRHVGFFAGPTLKQVDIDGGIPQTVTNTSPTLSVGATWNERGVILFSRAGAGIMRVAAAGGVPEPVTTLKPAELAHAWPSFLPDGRHFVYLRVQDTSRGELVWRDLDSGEERIVRPMSSKALYSSTGHLIFRNDGPVVAQRFDPATGAVSGGVIQIAAATYSNGPTRTALALSAAGVLAFRNFEGDTAKAQLTWVDKDGKTLSTVGPPADYRNVVVDRADAHAVANTVIDAQDVWMFDFKRATTSRLTFDAAVDSDPIFSPDGDVVAFYSTRNPAGIYRKTSSGAGAEQLLAETGLQSWPRDWSADGRFILYQKNSDLWVVPLDGDKKPFAYVDTAVRESDGRFSPDGRWVAYTSDETGRNEVFLQDFPKKGTKFQVSTAGGSEGRWRRDGRELFYLAADGYLMSVDVTLAPAFALGVPRRLFNTQMTNLGLTAQRRYGVSADGQRFLINLPLAGVTIEPITVTVNWQRLLKDR
jgi:eukaryotic-like serine/threonine-protein kinase